MTTHSSQQAQYIGRVGALAVALGIGVALTTGQGLGLAHADESSPSIDTKAPEVHSARDLAAPPHQPVPTMKLKFFSGRAVNVTRSQDASEPKVGVDSPKWTSPTHAARPDPNPPVEVSDPGPTTSAEPSAREPRPQRFSHSVLTPNVSPAVSGGAESPPIAEARQTERIVATPTTFTTRPPLYATPVSALHPLAVTALRPTAVAPVHPQLALPTAILRIATDALAALTSLVSPPPGTPVAPPPTLVALLAWVRREIHTAFDDAPVAKPDTYTTSEDTPLTITPATGVLANDTDVDGDTVTVSSYTQPAKGTVAVNTDGSLSYTPNPNANGTDTFSYVTSDGTTTSAPTTVTINVTPVNDPPVANPDAGTTNEDTPTTINLLANDTDADGDTLSVAGVTQGEHGSVALSGNTVTYTPDPNYNGTDTFSYDTFDGTTVSNIATVNITVTPVNDPPVANPDTYAALAGTPLTVDAADGVLGNDTDVDGDTLTVASYTQPSQGTVTLNPDGSFTYGAGAAANGADTFTYVTSDGTTTSAPTTVTINVTPPNHAPVANPDIVTTNEDVAVTINPLVNDTDQDGDTLTVASYTQPAHGTVALNTDGSFTYTPKPDANGPDTFSYVATDGTTASASTTVTINVTPVNDAPVINGGRAITPTYAETGVGTGNLAATDADGDPLTYSADRQGTNGSLVIGDDGQLTYTPNIEAQLDVLLQPRPSRTRPPLHPPTVISDTFVITATDPSGATSNVRVTFLVQAYDGPEAEELRDLQDQQDNLSAGAQQDIDLITFLIVNNGGTFPGPAGIVAGLNPSDPNLPELTEWAARDAQIQTIKQQVIDEHAAD